MITPPARPHPTPLIAVFIRQRAAAAAPILRRHLLCGTYYQEQTPRRDSATGKFSRTRREVFARTKESANAVRSETDFTRPRRFVSMKTPPRTSPDLECAAATPYPARALKGEA